MPIQVAITVGDMHLTAELNDTPTARRISEALPLSGQASVWGGEIYFTIPVHIDPAPDASAEVPVGALAYWPTGNVLCIFFGPTPVSVDEMPRAYSPVNVFGQVLGDTAALKKVMNGAPCVVKHATELK